MLIRCSFASWHLFFLTLCVAPMFLCFMSPLFPHPVCCSNVSVLHGTSFSSLCVLIQCSFASWHLFFLTLCVLIQCSFASWHLFFLTLCVLIQCSFASWHLFFLTMCVLIQCSFASWHLFFLTLCVDPMFLCFMASFFPHSVCGSNVPWLHGTSFSSLCVLIQCSFASWHLFFLTLCVDPMFLCFMAPLFPHSVCGSNVPLLHGTSFSSLCVLIQCSFASWHLFFLTLCVDPMFLCFMAPLYPHSVCGSNVPLLHGTSFSSLCVEIQRSFASWHLFFLTLCVDPMFLCFMAPLFPHSVWRSNVPLLHGTSLSSLCVWIQCSFASWHLFFLTLCVDPMFLCFVAPLFPHSVCGSNVPLLHGTSLSSLCVWIQCSFASWHLFFLTLCGDPTFLCFMAPLFPHSVCGSNVPLLHGTSFSSLCVWIQCSFASWHLFFLTLCVDPMFLCFMAPLFPHSVWIQCSFASWHLFFLTLCVDPMFLCFMAPLFPHSVC